MTEVQIHGFTFEKWVRASFFDDYQGAYMDKWDVPTDKNNHQAILAAFGRLPVSIKTAKYGSPVGLGDILRQRRIDHPFLMIVGFWRQRTKREKWIEEIGIGHFSVERWASLWGDLTMAQLERIDRIVKNLSVPHSVVRQMAQAWKQDTPAVASSRIVVNPKIDSKTQRRIQCSLPFEEFWRTAGRVPVQKDYPELFGVKFPNPIKSGARTFNKD